MPSWVNFFKYRSLLRFYEESFPEALALPKEENATLYSIVVGINQALTALHAGKNDQQKCTPDLANQVEALNKKMEELREYFSANRHFNSATRQALFAAGDYDEFLENAKRIDKHFNTSWNKLSQVLFTTHPRKPSSLPDKDDESTKAADLEANKQKYYANTPDGSLDDFEVTLEVLQKAVADFVERHGKNSIKLNVKNGHFDVTFSPPATGVLYASYSEYANFQRQFVKMLKQRAEEARPNPFLDVRAGAPDERARAPGQSGGHAPGQAGGGGGVGPTGKPLGMAPGG